MSSTAIKLGRNANVYRNTGSYGTPVWVQVTNIADCKVPATKKTDNVTTRAAAGYDLEAGTLISLGLEFTMNEDSTDADWTALQSSFLNFTAIELLVLNGTNATPSKGWRASYEVMDFGDNQDIDKVQKTEVKAKPTISANAPAWYSAP